MHSVNETHDPRLRSWVESANIPGHDFPLQNLPLGVFRPAGSAEAFRGGVAIGDCILDLASAARSGAFERSVRDVVALAAQPQLNALMAAGPDARAALRLALSRVLRQGAAQRPALETALLPRAQAEHALPARIGDFSDFYTSIHHATAVGKLFRPDQPLMPNYRWLPVG